MKYSAKLHLFSFLFVLTGFAVQAQISPHKLLTQYELKNWQAEDGLPQNSVTTIIQGSNGYLWIGTYDGLARFDGVTFTTINRKNNPKLASSYILSLAEDVTGAIWIGTSGDGIWTYHQNQLKKVSLSPDLEKADITHLLFDTRGNLWIGTYGKGLFRWDGKTLKNWTVEDGLPGNIIQTLHEANDGTLWGGTRGSGLFFVESDTEIIAVGEQSGLKNGYIRDMAELENGTLIIATAGGGIFLYENGRFEQYDTSKGLSSNGVNALQVDHSGTVWIATETGGLNRYAELRFSSIGSFDGIGSDAITTLFLDKESNLWIGTSGGGLTRLSDGKFTSVTVREGLASNFVWTVAEDKNGKIWLGTNGEGISVVDDLETYTLHQGAGLTNGYVRTILNATDGSMWVGTYNGLFKFVDERVVAHLTIENGLTSNIILSLYQDNQGIIWVGTSGGGVVGMKNNRIIKQYDTIDGLSNGYIRSIIRDSHGRLWLGTGGGGISIIDGDSLLTLNTDHGLESNTIIALYEDNRKRMWIGTHGGGLSMYEAEKVYTVTVLEGLPDDIIFHILEDSDAHLWMSSNRGVIRIHKRELLDFFYQKTKRISPMLFGKSDGMKSSECNGANQPAALRDSKGRHWFPTVKGASFVDADRLIIHPKPTPVILESIVLDYETILSDFPEIFEKRHQSYQFNYTSPTFTAIEKITFQVKLDGFDSDWIDKGNQRFTIYTNLPEGDYVFKVKARNGDRMVTENETMYAFTVPTPWFKTWWAYSLLFMLLAGVSSSAYWYQREALRRKKEEEMAMAQLKFDAERERLKRESSEAKARELETEYELEIQRRIADQERNEREKEKLSAQSFAEGIEKERSRIARELHDQILGTLSSIMRRIQIEAKRTADYDQLMSKLDALLMELDALGHDIRNIMDDLKPGSLEFFSLADTLESLLQKQTDLAIQYIKTSIRTPKILPELSPYQNVTIYRIFQEGIHNAIKHANPSEISIEITELPDNRLRFTLKNNGTPFDVNQTLLKANQMKSKSGNGLQNMQHRAQTINGEINWKSDDTCTEMTLIIPFS